MNTFVPDSSRDLVLERLIPVSVQAAWDAWTVPELMVQWFTPAPWKTVSADVDLRPGGRNIVTMESPEGEQFPNAGTYLVVEPPSLLVFTSVLTEGFRPVSPENGADDMPFTGRIELSAHTDGTLYRAIAIHPNAAVCAKHAEMGFHEGWGAALDQLVTLMAGR
jgi:uncharacterized protein YndB with AHSA1/START domain